MSKKTVLENKEDLGDLFFESRNSTLEKIAPEGIDTRTEEYLKINDGGIPVYTASMYIHKFPKNSEFASTYARLFGFPGVRTNVFIEPIKKSQDIIDKRVKNLDIELDEAETSRDPNRIRKTKNKYAKAEEWAGKIESGDNSLYKVQFLFTLKAASVDGLYRLMSDFRAKALSVQIELVSCYALQAEAYRGNYPLNKVPKFKNRDFIKPVVLDRHALGDIYNHTSCSFLHKNGVFLGHYMNTAQSFLFDSFDNSHDGFGALFAGMTGSGKSATIKMLSSRMIEFGVRFRALDLESKGRHGEYALTAEAEGGMVYSIKQGSDVILNPFDINVEMEYDPVENTEYEALHLAVKKAYLCDLIMCMITIGVGDIEVTLEKALRSIISSICNELYDERQIYDDVPDSLFTKDSDQFLSSGHTKKLMPTLKDALVKALIRQSLNDNSLHNQAYQTLVDTLSEQVRELYYSVNTIHQFTKEEFNKLPKDDNGIAYATIDGKNERVTAIRGSRAYFDGQSSVKSEFNTPFIDYDMSQVIEGDRPLAILVLLGYIEENDVKPNSANPKRTTPLGLILDELHILFPYPEARRIVDRFYRTARKRWVAPWAATQSIADFGNTDRYPELSGVFKNTDSYFLFRHTTSDREFLNKNTELTPSQIEKVFKLGIDPKDTEVTEEEKKRHSGEVCIIDKGRVAFVKVDYLENSEARYVESNVAKIKKAVG